MTLPIGLIRNMITKSTTLRSMSKVVNVAEKSVLSAESKAIAQSLGVMEQSPIAKILGTLKSTMVETFHLGKSTMPEVIALEQKMKSMGVRVTFEDNLETAKIITSAIEKVKEKGLKVPERIILMTPNAQNKGIKGWTTPYEDIILYNKDLKVSNGNSLPDFIKNMGIKPNATDTTEGVVFHEIGHRLQKKCPNAYEIWEKFTNSGHDVSLAKEVGYYAMTGDELNRGREFVAEVFAGLMSGKRYSSRVMAIYEALGGPQIPGVNMAGVDIARSSSSGSCDIFRSMKKTSAKGSDTIGILSSILSPQKSNILNISLQKSGSKTSLSDLISTIK